MNAHTSLLIGDAHLDQIIRNRQFAADSRVYLIEGDAGGDLAQANPSPVGSNKP